MRSFIRWLWGQDAIESLPKNIDSKELRITRRTKAPEAMTLDEVGTLLRGTTGLNQLCILLGLNCGMTQKDISDLLDTDASWAEGTITRKRSKTLKHVGVPTVTYKPWPETLRLLQRHRSGGEIVLLTHSGKRLVEERLDESGTYRKSDSVKAAYDRALTKLPMKKPLKLLRKTSATLINAHPLFRSLAPLFLGHAPATIAEKHYIATSKNALNEAIDYLRVEYQIGEIVSLKSEKPSVRSLPTSLSELKPPVLGSSPARFAVPNGVLNLGAVLGETERVRRAKLGGEV